MAGLSIGRTGVAAGLAAFLVLLTVLFRVTVHFGAAGYVSLLIEARPAERYNVLLLHWPENQRQARGQTTLVVNCHGSWRWDG